MKDRCRTIVVSNRLPVQIACVGGDYVTRPSAGGLVTAMLPVIRGTGGMWIGWPGTTASAEAVGARLADAAVSMGIGSLVPVCLDAHEEKLYYGSCCNEIIWPLFHDLVCRCKFDPEAWEVYREVNEKFADVIEQQANRGDFVWVHDYQLMLVGEALRDRGTQVKTAYFHHIPFPSPDIFAKLPWRMQVLRALLQFNEIGFQTGHDCRNFVRCLQRFLPDSAVFETGGGLTISAEGLTTHARSCSISIDFGEFAAEASSEEIFKATALGSLIGTSRLLVGVDRLDYTKGLPERLFAFENLLRSHPELHGTITLLQVVVPSREEIGEYRELKQSLEMLVSRINGDFATESWTPIRYLHQCLSRPELLAIYRAADIMLVTSLKDGMNLVSKEFCASRTDQQGVLVLSEFAGAAAELGCGALVINPYDRQQTAAAILRGLHMSPAEQQSRMARMRDQVRTHDVFDWARSLHVTHTRSTIQPLPPVTGLSSRVQTAVGA